MRVKSKWLASISFIRLADTISMFEHTISIQFLSWSVNAQFLSWSERVYRRHRTFDGSRFDGWSNFRLLSTRQHVTFCGLKALGDYFTFVYKFLPAFFTTFKRIIRRLSRSFFKKLSNLYKICFAIGVPSFEKMD